MILSTLHCKMMDELISQCPFQMDDIKIRSIVREFCKEILNILDPVGEIRCFHERISSMDKIATCA